MKLSRKLVVVGILAISAFGLNAGSFDELKAKAASGEAKAQFELGKSYLNGKGVTRDDAEALIWFTRAAEQGDAFAQHNLGLMYLEGRGVKADPQNAVLWLTKSAEQGTERSQKMLASLLARNPEVQDLMAAIYWHETLANKGDGKSQAWLGNLYYFGRDDIQKDDALALKWLKSAATQGDAVSQNILGVIYENGQLGQPRNLERAEEWYRKAAAQGERKAQGNLGRFYYQGTVVDRNLPMAWAWLQLGAAKGDLNSQNLVAEVEARLTPEQRVEAESLLGKISKR